MMRVARTLASCSSRREARKGPCALVQGSRTLASTFARTARTAAVQAICVQSSLQITCAPRSANIHTSQDASHVRCLEHGNEQQGSGEDAKDHEHSRVCVPKAPTCGACGGWQVKVCITSDCARKSYARGLCRSCYYKTTDVGDRVRKSQRERSRKFRTGWTPEDVERAWLTQKGMCAICTGPMAREYRKPNSMCADHCHVRKTKRALLCWTCNVALGYYESYQSQFIAIETYDAYRRAHVDR